VHDQQDDAGGVAVTALLARMASHRRSAEYTLAALVQQMELAARPA
jgi:hypothetical protein